MDSTELLLEIEAAKKVIGDAEDELQRVVADGPAAPRDEEVKVAEVVRAASLRLKTAKANLIDLERSLALAKIDEKKVELAKLAISEAETNLDRVLDQIVVETPLQETWVTEAVESAFSKLRTAKKELADLERSIATDPD